MSDLRTAAQQALEALEQSETFVPYEGFGMARREAERKHQAAITALRAALAQKEEPTRSQQMVAAGFKTRDTRLACDECGGRYTPQMLPIHKCAQRAEPVQEPVAWRFKPMIGSPWSLSDDGYYISCKRDKGYIVEPLYAAPPQRKPLPNHDQHCVDVPGYGLMAVRLVRAVERAHGIKE